MRYRGRMIIAKVDEFGERIKNLKVWINKNPNSLYLDSYLEWEVWKYIQDNTISHTYQPKLNLFSSISTKEFEKPRQTKKAKEEKRNQRKVKDVVQKPIGYTPDFYLPDFNVYVEVKGFADSEFKLRWKLFKIQGYEGFIVYSLDEFIQLYKQLK